MHAALVFMGFRKKKRRKDFLQKKKSAEDAEGDDDDARRAAATTTRRRADDALFSQQKPPRFSAPKEKEPFRKTLALARDEALGSVAEALVGLYGEKVRGAEQQMLFDRFTTSLLSDAELLAKLHSVSPGPVAACPAEVRRSRNTLVT